MTAANLRAPVVITCGLSLLALATATLPDPWSNISRALNGFVIAVLLLRIILHHNDTEVWRQQDKEELRAHRQEIIDIQREGMADRKRLLESMQEDTEDLAARKRLAAKAEQTANDMSQKMDNLLTQGASTKTTGESSNTILKENLVQAEQNAADTNQKAANVAADVATTAAGVASTAASVASKVAGIAAGQLDSIQKTGEATHEIVKDKKK